jgi:hypothetical protein
LIYVLSLPIIQFGLTPHGRANLEPTAKSAVGYLSPGSKWSDDPCFHTTSSVMRQKIAKKEQNGGYNPVSKKGSSSGFLLQPGIEPAGARLLAILKRLVGPKIASPDPAGC